MPAKLCLRPWALKDPRGNHCQDLTPSPLVVPAQHRGALWLYAPPGFDATPGNRPDTPEPVPGFTLEPEDGSLSLLPLPLRQELRLPEGPPHLAWPSIPERPPANSNPKTDEEREAHRLMLRAQGVWDRLRDVEDALVDPLPVWPELRRRWMVEEKHEDPQMDVIVRQAETLCHILERFARSLRSVLRRSLERVPVQRVQELDRRSMQALVRQPGKTLAERAGDDQRLVAVARRESYDTLENRVLHAYAELASVHTRDYIARNDTKRTKPRAQSVLKHGRRCQRLARELAARGVRRAEPGVRMNYVLQSNPEYRKIWDGWQKLLRQDAERDDLWRWQPVSWEEFAAVGVMVALTGIPGAQLIASSPLLFRPEQRRGSWLQHDNPLGVFHLPHEGIVVEVRYRLQRPERRLSRYAAALWIKLGRVDATLDNLANIAIWPLWDAVGGLVPGEEAELAALLAQDRQARLTGGIIIRPAVNDHPSESTPPGDVLALTLGTGGPALSEGLIRLRADLAARLGTEAE